MAPCKSWPLGYYSYNFNKLLRGQLTQPCISLERLYWSALGVLFETAKHLSSYVYTGSPVWHQEFHATSHWLCIGWQAKGCMELLKSNLIFRVNIDTHMNWYLKINSLELTTYKTFHTNLWKGQHLSHLHKSM